MKLWNKKIKDKKIQTRMSGATLMESIMALAFLGIVVAVSFNEISHVGKVNRYLDFQNEIESIRILLRSSLSCQKSMWGPTPNCNNSVFIPGRDLRGDELITPDKDGTQLLSYRVRLRCDLENNLMIPEFSKTKQVAVVSEDKGKGGTETVFAPHPLYPNQTMGWTSLFGSLPMGCLPPPALVEAPVEEGFPPPEEPTPEPEPDPKKKAGGSLPVAPTPAPYTCRLFEGTGIPYPNWQTCNQYCASFEQSCIDVGLNSSTCGDGAHWTLFGYGTTLGEAAPENCETVPATCASWITDTLTTCGGKRARWLYCKCI